MSKFLRRRAIGISALLGSSLFGSLAHAASVQTVFVIAMENHNWVQPDNKFTGSIQQIYLNPAAPFINALVGGTATATVNGQLVNISGQTAWATNYHHVLASPSGNNPRIHPSEPNYIWAEAGSNLGVVNDNDPFATTGPTNQNTTLHLATLLTASGKTWKSYQEDIDLTTDSNGKLTNVPLPSNQWTVPLKSISGTFSSGTNAYNGSNQYDYATKHNPMVFFTDSNGGNDSTPNNPLASHYAPLQQLQTDLNNNTVANYNWITPNQHNDMHTTLTGGYQGLTGDPAKIKQGDDFLKQIIPVIMASQAYKNNGAIIIWWDESEADGVPGDKADDFNHTIGEIVISPLAHPNVSGVPYASPLNYTHSSDLRTMEEIFGLRPFVLDANYAYDLSDLFAPGTIPTSPLYEYQFFKPGTTTVGAAFRFSGLVRDISPASTPIPGYTGFSDPSPGTLYGITGQGTNIGCPLISRSSGELECRGSDPHSGLFYYQFDFGHLPTGLGTFTGNGFTSPDGTTPGIGAVGVLGGQVVQLQ